MSAVSLNIYRFFQRRNSLTARHNQEFGTKNAGGATQSPYATFCQRNSTRLFLCSICSPVTKSSANVVKILATISCTSSTSTALQTEGRLVLAFSIIAKALSDQRLHLHMNNSVPVSITGTMLGYLTPESVPRLHRDEQIRITLGAKS